MHFILGTAGHIDHGKSSLVQALTGVDPDRLPEEKARGVTIDLGFAHLSLEDKNNNYEIGIIDVPGHADFVNNMVSGVGALDLAVFIVAADDGWMPQSEEHLHILSYLGVKNIIIALTKIDLCEDVPFTIEVLRDELQDTAISNCPIIPVSSYTGEGIENLKKQITQSLQNTPAPANLEKPRLSIDRIFSPKGTGTVVTGTLSGGKISLGETLHLHPLGLTTRVRYIQNHNQSLETASPGMRTALNLPDLPIHTAGKQGAERGNTLTFENTGEPTDTLDILLKRIPRPIPGTKPRVLRHTETVILHHGSTRSHARVILHDINQLQPGESCLAQLRLEAPLYFLTGDHIVLRDGAQQNTLAGGIVLDAQPQRQGFRTESRSEFLKPRASKPHCPSTQLSTLLKRDTFLKSTNPLPNNPFSETSIQKLIQTMITEGEIIQQNDILLESKKWNTILTKAKKTIQQWHQQYPNLPSMPIDELETSLTSHCPKRLLQFIPDALIAKNYQKQGKGIAHPNHTLTLPAHLEQEAKNILNTLHKTGLQPPNKNDLTPTSPSEQALQFLIRSEQAIQLEPKVVISKQTLKLATEKICSFIQANGQATASELRQHLDSTRKTVMPLLEHLDAQGITKRNGNYRTLKAENSQ